MFKTKLKNILIERENMLNYLYIVIIQKIDERR